MRRLALFVIGGAVWLLLLAIPVLADGGPHVSGQATNAATGSCASCHRAHSGQQPFLVRDALPALCYTCHGTGNGGARTDVMNGVGYSNRTTAHADGANIPPAAGALRAGGFEYALIATNVAGPNPGTAGQNAVSRVGTIPVAAAPALATSAHSVDGSAVKMWGNGALGDALTYQADVQLTCASCHDPHGNGQYRILKSAPDDAIVSAPTTWAASTAYLVGAQVTTTATSHSFTATVAGTSGATVPTWPITGGTVTDGGVTWQDSGVAILGVKVNDASIPTGLTVYDKLYTTTNYGQLGQFATDAAESPLNLDGSALNYDSSTKMFSGTFLEASSRWCAMCHTRYFAQTGAAGNRDWTVGGSVDSVYKFRHATRNIVDPTTNGAPTTGVINPISSFSQLKPGATIGSYTATSSGVVFTYRGVAITNATTSGLYSVSNLGNGTTSITGQVGDNLTTSAPRCITCHLGHGTNSDPGTITGQQTSLVTNGTLGSTLLRLDGRTVCQACHAK